MFEEQAQKTLAGYYVERERVREAQRVERMGRAVRVPEGFGVEWVGAGAGAGAGGVGAGVEGMGGGEGGKGRVDSSRDPRLRRE